MANPQTDDGYTRIANETIEKFCCYRLSGEEWLVLWVVIRQTYGYQKKEDAISLSQFAVKTGLKRPTVVRAINKLVSKKLLAVIKNDNTYINKYRFNKDFDQWAVLSKKITGVSKKIISGIKNDNKSVIKKDTYKRKKETITKEIVVTKEITPLDYELSNLLLEEIKNNLPTFKSPNIDEWANHVSKMRRLDNRTPEQIEYIIKWCQQDHFWQGNILSTKKLREKFDQLIAQVKRANTNSLVTEIKI